MTNQTTELLRQLRIANQALQDCRYCGSDDCNCLEEIETELKLDES